MIGGTAAGPILIVEDDPSIRQLLREALEQDGLEVVSASDGEEAVELPPQTAGGPVTSPVT